eukprot:12644499-Alexandrium_andersonii.AAC.1
MQTARGNRRGGNATVPWSGVSDIGVAVVAECGAGFRGRHPRRIPAAIVRVCRQGYSKRLGRTK